MPYFGPIVCCITFASVKYIYKSTPVKWPGWSRLPLKAPAENTSLSLCSQIVIFANSGRAVVQVLHDLLHPLVRRLGAHLLAIVHLKAAAHKTDSQPQQRGSPGRETSPQARTLTWRQSEGTAGWSRRSPALCPRSQAFCWNVGSISSGQSREYLQRYT